MINIKKYTKAAAKAVTMLFVMQLALFTSLVTTSCSDEPDEENYYTFTGQMASDYLKSNADFSEFATIVERAGLMDLLSAYGHFTCFPPDNNAINTYLASRGLTLDQLSVADCDTIARTHLVNTVFSISDMSKSSNGGILRTQNMMRRNLEVSHSVDANGNAVLVINGNAQIYFEHQDDSVENGIMQPVNAVITNSTKSVANLIKNNKRAGIYYAALKATGLDVMLDTMKEDKSYVKPPQEYYAYKTGAETELEWAISPEQRLLGFTFFVAPDDVLKKKYGKYFDAAESDLKALYNLACDIYDPMYPDDVYTEAHQFSHLDQPANPLYRFIAYHLLPCKIQGYNELTVRDDMGVIPTYDNAVDWYVTMLPGKMIKVEHLINLNFVGSGDVTNGYYINRRYDNEKYFEHGIYVSKPAESVDAENGIYFYLDDVLKFDETTRDVVHNCRIRMDFSTLFPEIITNKMRMNGKYDDYTRQNINDDDIGYNYNFPQGYLNGVKIAGTDAKLIYRRPRMNFYSMHGDEMIANGVFDITFVLPPFPFDGDWQIRLGFAPMDPSTGASRGAVQVFYDGTTVGLPINIDTQINSAEIYGATAFPKYSDIRNDVEKRTADYKILKNKGYYRGPFSVYHSHDGLKPNDSEKFADQPCTVRKVLHTLTVHKSDLGKNHTLRVMNVSAQNASNKEAMFDYLELVPKSVYGVTGDNIEDDL